MCPCGMRKRQADIRAQWLGQYKQETRNKGWSSEIAQSPSDQRKEGLTGERTGKALRKKKEEEERGGVLSVVVCACDDELARVHAWIHRTLNHAVGSEEGANARGEVICFVATIRIPPGNRLVHRAADAVLLVHRNQELRRVQLSIHGRDQGVAGGAGVRGLQGSLS